jgi:dihydrofolate reductase
MTVALIAAVARNGVIGADNGMPWRLRTDLQRFKQITLGKPVVMGRRTFESLGKPLSGRLNIVVTRQSGFSPEGAASAPSLEAGLALAAREAGPTGEIMVVGGGQLYAGAIGLADRLYITHVEAAPDGDTRFPRIDPAVWRAVSREAVPAGERDSAATEFVVYERIRP